MYSPHPFEDTLIALMTMTDPPLVAVRRKGPTR
jgi:hypothetical protein